MSFFHARGALLTAFFLLLPLPILAEEGSLKAPTGLTVERDEELYKGRWEPVSGASYYEVWVNNFGNWNFDENEFQYSPFTSSFEARILDVRARFKVRAVGPRGEKSEFSNVARPTIKVVKEDDTNTSTATAGGRSGPKIDPKAPPPEPPTSLFAIWTEHDVIKLVWQDSKGAKNYSVEELVDDRWVSIPIIEFPRPSTALIKKHPSPGPYKFRVRAVGANGRASEPSRATTAKR